MWAFRVREGAQEEFERLYGANGEWVRLFRRSPAYVGTELWRDRDQPNRYITVDRWRSRAERERFLREERSDYAVLDALGRRLTTAEARLASLDRIGA
jgi:heme-degrading monooxygenase HmoA